MHELMKLKEILCKELEEYGSKGELTSGTLEVVDKLAHAVKNLDKIIKEYDGEDYSSRGSYRYPMDSRNDGRSYARRRDSMGRYSRDDNMIAKLEDLMRDAPNEQIKQQIRQLVNQMEQM